MKADYHDIEDFLTDESFRDWVKKPTPEIDQQWKAWLQANPTKVDLVNASREIIQSLHFKQYQAETGLKDSILLNIQDAVKPRRKEITFFNTWYKVAAVLIFLLGIGALLRSSFTDIKTDEPLSSVSSIIKQSNRPGVKSKLILSDGSTIFLNSGSSIEYPERFGSNVREVKLKGEAFFQISKDVKRPFKVLSDGFEVVVLGTMFNVNTTLKSPSVALVEGKVLLNSDDHRFSLQLEPGQMGRFDKIQSSFSSTGFDIEYITGWKDGYLMFRDATFDEVVEKLHVWYGVQIKVTNKGKSGDWSYTAKFKNEDLKIVLKNMSTLRKFDYQIKSDSLMISF